jgi:hypothetical protein
MELSLNSERIPLFRAGAEESQAVDWFDSVPDRAVRPDLLRAVLEEH